MTMARTETRSRRGGRVAIACVLAGLAIASIAAPAIGQAVDTDRVRAPTVVHAPCRAASIADGAGCENWVEDWTGPNEHSMHLPETVVSDDGETLVEAGTSYASNPFARVGAVARDVASGEIVWERGWLDPYTKGIEIVSSLAVGPEDERLYVAGATQSGEGFLLALDLDNGIVDWQNLYPGEVTSVVTGEGQLVFAAGGLDAVWSLERDTGDRAWTTEIGGDHDDVIKLSGGPLVTEQAGVGVVAIDPATGERVWTTPLETPDGEVGAVIEMAGSRDGAWIAVVQATDCGPGDGAPVVRVLNEEGAEAWTRVGGCVDRGTTTSPVFAGNEEVVVPFAYVPDVPDDATTVFPASNVTSYDIHDGEVAWQAEAIAPPNREILYGEASSSPDGERVYVSGSLRPPVPVHGENPTENGYILARSIGCYAERQQPPIPRSGLLFGYDEAMVCERRPTWDGFAAAFDAERGQALGRMVHEGPFHTEGEQLAVSPSTGDVLVSGFARDERAQTRFRTSSWPAQAWTPANR
jgi:outer membrane protein assembly factor BamB